MNQKPYNSHSNSRDSLYRSTEQQGRDDAVNVQHDKAYAVKIYSNDVIIPQFCSCCMKRTGRQEENILRSESTNTVSLVGVSQFPVCNECERHRKEFGKKRNLVIVLALAAGLITMLALMMFVKPDDWIAAAAGGGALLLVYFGLYFGLKLKYLPIGHSSRFNSVMVGTASAAQNVNNSSLYRGTGSGDSSKQTLVFTNPQYAQALFEANDGIVGAPQEQTMENSAPIRSIAKLDKQRVSSFLKALVPYLLLAFVGVWLNMSYNIFRNVSLDSPVTVAGQGAVSGAVVDAVTGDPVSNAHVSFYPDADRGNEPAYTCDTDDNGLYNISLPAGVYHTEFSKDGYEAATLTVICIAEKETDKQNCVMSPLLYQGQIRIVLEWGATPPDLDSHLVNSQQNIHVYYSRKDAHSNGHRVVNLDLDDTTSYGPETVTIEKQQDGEYVYCVHDYSNQNSRSSDQMAKSGAKVTVYLGNDVSQTFYVPERPGTCWKVFTLQNGTINEVNEMSFVSNPESVGR